MEVVRFLQTPPSALRSLVALLPPRVCLQAAPSCSCHPFQNLSGPIWFLSAPPMSLVSSLALVGSLELKQTLSVFLLLSLCLLCVPVPTQLSCAASCISVHARECRFVGLLVSSGLFSLFFLSPSTVMFVCVRGLFPWIHVSCLLGGPCSSARFLCESIALFFV